MTLNGGRKRRGASDLFNRNDKDFKIHHRNNETTMTKRICYKHNKRKNNLIFFPPTLTILLLLIILTTTAVVVQAQIPDTDNYCGPSWVEAANLCSQPCATKSDAECTTPGHTCFEFTGCQAKLALTEVPSTTPTKFPTLSPTVSNEPTTTPPTGSPTFTPSASPSSSPSGAPTKSPIVNWYPAVDTTVDTLTNGQGIMFVEDDPSLRSYGCIFELESGPTSPAIAIKSLEILISYDDELFTGSSGAGSSGANATAATAVTTTTDTNITNAEAKIAYELWTRPNTWHGFEGRVRAFDKLSEGNITITNGQLSHRGEKLMYVTIDNFDPIQLDGGGLDRRAVYVTLSSRNLLYQRSSKPLETEAISSIEEVETQSILKDTIVLAETDHLVVYEGAAVMTFPFKEAKESIFYRMPRGFVGKIVYDRDPCELIPAIDENGTDTGEMMSAIKWADCVQGTKPPRPTVEPTAWVKPRWTLAPTTKIPSQAPVPLPQYGDPTGAPVLSPTSTPSISAKPTIFIMKSYLILTFDNIRQRREMDAREQNSFEKKIVSFLNEQKAVKTNEVIIEGASIVFQQTYTTEEREQAAKRAKKKESRNSNVDGRLLQEGESLEGTEAKDSSISSGEAGMDLIVPSPPEKPFLEVTVVISVESSPLPQKITSQLFRTMIQNKKTEFLAEVKEVDSLSDLFSTTNDMPVIMSVEKVTSAPTRRPTRAPVVPVVEEEGSSLFSSASSIALLIVGLVWVGLVFMSFTRIKKARQLMKIANARRFLGEDTFKAPHHGMVYGDERKDKDDFRKSRRRSSGGMKASLLGGFGGGKKKKKDDRRSSFKDDDYSDRGSYSEEDEEYLSSMVDSYSSGESVSEESSGSY